MTDDPLAEAEAIVRSEEARLTEMSEQVRQIIRGIARTACITEEQASEAYSIFELNVINGARASNVPVTVFLERMHPARRQMILGMIIGGLLCGQQLQFVFYGQAPGAN